MEIILRGSEIPEDLREFFEPVAPVVPDVFRIATRSYPGSHFATFPPALVEPMILAGTSERGCCAECGGPWTRTVESNNPSKSANTGSDLTNGAAKTANPQTSAGLHRNNGGVYSTRQMVGWQPSCTCNAAIVPCTVLDPFVGSGTTIKVALQHKRRAIGVDISNTYLDELVPERIAGIAQELSGEFRTITDDNTNYDLPLFAAAD